MLRDGGRCNDAEADAPNSLRKSRIRRGSKQQSGPCLEMHRTRAERSTLMSLIDLYHLTRHTHGGLSILPLLAFLARSPKDIHATSKSARGLFAYWPRSRTKGLKYRSIKCHISSNQYFADSSCVFSAALATVTGRSLRNAASPELRTVPAS